MEQEILTQLHLAEVQADEERQGNLLKDHERRFEPNCAPKEVEVGHFFYALPSPNGAKNQSWCQEYTLPRKGKETCAKGWIESDARFGPVSDIKVSKTHGSTALKFHLYSKIKPLLGLELWTVLKSTSERQFRSKKKKELRGNPLHRRDQDWNRPQQAIGNLFRWHRESGSTLKWNDPRTFIASRCQNSLHNYFDTRKLVEKKMPVFLVIELLRNTRMFYERIQDIGQTKQKKN